MRNKSLEKTIHETIDTFPESPEFKQMLKQYVENSFKGNISDSDLQLLLNFLEVAEDEL